MSIWYYLIPCIIDVVSYTSIICIILLYDTPHYDQAKSALRKWCWLCPHDACDTMHAPSQKYRRYKTGAGRVGSLTKKFHRDTTEFHQIQYVPSAYISNTWAPTCKRWEHRVLSVSTMAPWSIGQVELLLQIISGIFFFSWKHYCQAARFRTKQSCKDLLEIIRIVIRLIVAVRILSNRLNLRHPSIVNRLKRRLFTGYIYPEIYQ
jgi:hypothetical protein